MITYLLVVGVGLEPASLLLESINTVSTGRRKTVTHAVKIIVGLPAVIV